MGASAISAASQMALHAKADSRGSLHSANLLCSGCSPRCREENRQRAAMAAAVQLHTLLRAVCLLALGLGSALAQVSEPCTEGK